MNKFLIFLVATAVSFGIGSLITNQKQPKESEKPSQKAEQTEKKDQEETQKRQLALQKMEEIKNMVMPHGMPPYYGEELGLTFDINVSDQRKMNEVVFQLAAYDEGEKAIKITDKKLLERYVKVGMSAACEFCCGARTLVFKNGEKACSCSHSAAMRGILKYMLQNHGQHFTNQELLTQVNNWKALFFPAPTIDKYIAQVSASGQLDPEILKALPKQSGSC